MQLRTSCRIFCFTLRKLSNVLIDRLNGFRVLFHRMRFLGMLFKLKNPQNKVAHIGSLLYQGSSYKSEQQDSASRWVV